VQQPDRHGLLDRGIGDGQLRGVGNRDHWTQPPSRSLGHGWRQVNPDDREAELAQGERDDAGADPNLHHWGARIQEWGQVPSCRSSALLAPVGGVIAVSDSFEGQG
jgi:hypothetical protein